jgi:hypothetical protein
VSGGEGERGERGARSRWDRSCLRDGDSEDVQDRTIVEVVVVGEHQNQWPMGREKHSGRGRTSLRS